MVGVREVLVVLGCFISINDHYNCIMALVAEKKRDGAMLRITGPTRWLKLEPYNWEGNIIVM